MHIAVLLIPLHTFFPTEISLVERQSPLAFRPERPVPIGRDQIREKNQQSRPSAPPQLISRPALRQEIREDPVPVRQTQPRQQVRLIDHKIYL